MAAHSVAPAPSISETFSRLKEEGKIAFIPFIIAGDPDLSTTSKALKILDASGSDLIELGIPYSDPLADGPVIQAAATRALAKGTKFDGVISMLSERSYVVYPPEGPRPPSPEELREMAREIARKNNTK